MSTNDLNKGYSKKIFVVMRNHNAYELTSKCLKSILKCSYKNLEIIVVDDGSSDRSGEKILEKFPQIILLQSKKYIEYCKGLNMGIRYSLSKKADFVFIVNNDTENFSENYFEALLSGFENDKSVGMVGSLVYDYDGNKRSAGVANTRLGVFVDTPTEGYMFSSKVLNEVGLFDEQLVRYFEDFDYLIRMRNMGFKSLCVHDVSFDHLGGGTSKKQLFVPNFYRVRNLIWFIKRYRKNESMMWKFKQFRGFMKKHIMLVLKHLKELRFIKALCVSVSILLGLFVGTFSSWDNNIYE